MLQRSKASSARRASRCSSRMAGCLTLYSPLSCLATSSESPTRSTSVAPSARARSSPRRTARYSATLFVARPIGSATSSSTWPSPSATTTPMAAGPGLPRAPPSTWTSSFTEASRSLAGRLGGELGQLADDAGPAPVANGAVAAARGAGLAPRGTAAVDDDRDVGVVGVVAGELGQQLVGQRLGNDAVDHSTENRLIVTK